MRKLSQNRRKRLFLQPWEAEEPLLEWNFDGILVQNIRNFLTLKRKNWVIGDNLQQRKHPFIKAASDAYKKRKNGKNVSGVGAGGGTGGNGNPKSSKKQKTKFNKAVKLAATEIIASVVATTKAENEQKETLQAMQLQISDLQVSGATDKGGKANTSSVKPGKSVTFETSTSDAVGQAMMTKLAVIVGRAQVNKN